MKMKGNYRLKIDTSLLCVLSKSKGNQRVRSNGPKSGKSVPHQLPLAVVDRAKNLIPGPGMLPKSSIPGGILDVPRRLVKGKKQGQTWSRHPWYTRGTPVVRNVPPPQGGLYHTPAVRPRVSVRIIEQIEDARNFQTLVSQSVRQSVCLFVSWLVSYLVTQLVSQVLDQSFNKFNVISLQLGTGPVI